LDGGIGVWLLVMEEDWYEVPVKDIESRNIGYVPTNIR
jgi:hypothetical protein